ncbi:MAG: hypothetical protein R3A51_16085 [Nannocystaceae bacterium]
MGGELDADARHHHALEPAETSGAADEERRAQLAGRAQDRVGLRARPEINAGVLMVMFGQPLLEAPKRARRLLVAVLGERGVGPVQLR